MSDEQITIVRKALAGVARLRRRAGLTALAASLSGQRTKRVEQLGLDLLSTHGVLAEHPEEWVLRLLRRLLTASFVELTPTDYPVPFLTRDGIEAMKGDREIRIVLPEKIGPRSTRQRSSSKAPPGTCDDPVLFEKLRQVRATLAKDKGVPAYVVCHNRSLSEMANDKPLTTEALQRIHGMGPARVDQYGEAFVAAIRDNA
jgi:ATP-dependent DNA helicase RecQ